MITIPPSDFFKHNIVDIFPGIFDYTEMEDARKIFFHVTNKFVSFKDVQALSDLLGTWEIELSVEKELYLGVECTSVNFPSQKKTTSDKPPTKTYKGEF